MSRNPFVALLGGFTAWAGAFLLLYGLQATGCRMGWDTVTLAGVPLLRLALIAGFLLTIGALLLAKRYFYASEGENDVLSRIVNLANGAAVISAFCYVGTAWLVMC